MLCSLAYWSAATSSHALVDWSTLGCMSVAVRWEWPLERATGDIILPGQQSKVDQEKNTMHAIGDEAVNELGERDHVRVLTRVKRVTIAGRILRGVNFT